MSEHIPRDYIRDAEAAFDRRVASRVSHPNPIDQDPGMTAGDTLLALLLVVVVAAAITWGPTLVELILRVVR